MASRMARKPIRTTRERWLTTRPGRPQAEGAHKLLLGGRSGGLPMGRRCRREPSGPPLRNRFFLPGRPRWRPAATGAAADRRLPAATGGAADVWLPSTTGGATNIWLPSATGAASNGWLGRPPRRTHGLGRPTATRSGPGTGRPPATRGHSVSRRHETGRSAPCRRRTRARRPRRRTEQPA